MTNRKSHIYALSIGAKPLLMTKKGRYALCFKTHASFGAHHENLNEDRRILS